MTTAVAAGFSPADLGSRFCFPLRAPYLLCFVWVLLAELAERENSLGKHGQVQVGYIRKVPLKYLLAMFRPY